MTEWHRVRALFEEALGLPEQEQEAFLTTACGDDTDLKDRVAGLLQRDRATTDHKPPIEVRFPGRLLEIAAHVSGQRVGAYTIRRVLGAGGMGTVFEAEQEQPKRLVALKMMATGLHSDAARRRFEYEAEVLAKLRHPGIAQVYDVGTHCDPITGQQVPYFAMEYVEDAKPVTTYVQEAGLDLAGLLDLFLGICEVVQSGHQLGVIHRDLKPANILVDRSGRPKIIDFGIARASADVVDITRQTAASQVLGTLPYMSPEQLQPGATDVDTRADVYALGVLLYELLTGRPPFDPKEMPIHVFAKFVGEQEAERPSAAPTTQRDVAGDVAGDLDWITLKALAKEKTRRYGSVSELATDIRRHLAHEPVFAGPPSAGYRLKKFVRRNRVWVAAGTVLLLAVAGGTTTTAVAYFRAVRAEKDAREQATEATQQAALARQQLARAETEADTQAEISKFFQNMIQMARVDHGGPDVPVGRLLDVVSPQIWEKYSKRPHVAAGLHNSIGATYINLGKFDKARPHLEAAVELGKQEMGTSHPVTITAMSNLGAVYRRLGKLDRSEGLARQVLAGWIDRHGKDSSEAAYGHTNLAVIQHRLGKRDQALDNLRRAREVFVLLHGEQHHDTISVTSSLATALRSVGRLDEAAEMSRRTYDASVSFLGEKHSTTLSAMNGLASIESARENLPEAEKLFRRCLVLQEQVRGKDHPNTLETLRGLATVLRDRDKLAEAETLLRRGLAHKAATRDVMNTLIATLVLGSVLERQGKLKEAEEVFVGLHSQVPATMKGHWLTGAFDMAHGVCLRKQRRFEEAETRLVRALKVLEASHAGNRPRVRRTLQALVDLYRDWGKPAMARSYEERQAKANGREK